LNNNESPDTPTSAGKVFVSRGLLIGIAGGAAVLLVAIGVLVGVLLSSSSSPNAAPTREPSTAPSQSAVQPKPETPEAEPLPETYALGEPVSIGPVTLTVNSVEVTDSVTTTDGVPITPDAGGQLVVVRTTYVNSKTQADLSCGNTDLYIQLYDANGLEMAPVFELYRLPGNPECNAHQLQNQPHEWTILFQSIAGAKPTLMSLMETLSYSQQELVNLT